MLFSDILDKINQEQENTIEKVKKYNNINLEKNLTDYNLLKEKYSFILKDKKSSIQEKAQAKTMLFKIDYAIKEIENKLKFNFSQE